MDNNQIKEEIKDIEEIIKEDIVVKKDNTKTIVSAILVAAIIIALAILLKDTKPNPKKVIPERQEATKGEVSIRPIDSTDHILGNPNAKIKIVEYSDTSCPFCKIFHATMHKVIENNPDVAWVYRHFPIASIHPNAANEALATECAYEQGGNDAFWAFTDQIYQRTKSNNTFGDSDLLKIAEDLDLTIYAFNECMQNQTYADKIENDIVDGQLGGVRGTPHSFIFVDGKYVDEIGGAAPYESVEQALNSLRN